ncbi:MAG: DUF3500 domain-containing protein [Planctomycetota bacterium]
MRDLHNPMDRRLFLKNLGLFSSLIATGCGSQVLHGHADPLGSAQPQARDSLAMQLFKSLNPGQREAICLPPSHATRDFISNWWYVLPEHRITNTFNDDQQELILDLFNSLHSEEHRRGVAQHMIKDQYNDPDNAPSVAFYGTPDDEDFEFIFTGHHVTRRCLVHAPDGRGFGNRPVFYGTYVGDFNESKDHPGNPYWYQGRILNTFFRELDGKQQALALSAREPRSEDDTMVISRCVGDWPGLPCADLSRDHKELLLKSMEEMLALFRPADVAATMATIRNNRLIDGLHLSCYQGRHDIGDDGVWDTWQIEGPNLVWYFRGQPHVHCYFHLAT